MDAVRFHPAMASPTLRIESPSIHVENRRLHTWGARLAVVGGWGVCMALLSAFAPDLTGCYGTPLTFACLALLVGSLRGSGAAAGTARRGQPGAVTVEDGALRVEIGGRTQTIARDQVSAGWTEEGRGSARVTLQSRTGALVALDVPSAGAAHALLEALGVAPEQRAVAVQVGSPHTPARRFLLALVGLLSLAAAAPSALVSVAAVVQSLRLGSTQWLGVLVLVGPVVLVSSIGAWRCLRQLGTTTLRIGTDGISIHRRWRRQFVPRAEIAGVDVDGATLVVKRRSRPPLATPTTGLAEAATLARRVADALAGPAAAVPAEVLATLDRGDRSIAEWQRALAALLGESAGYRRGAVVADDLFRVLEDGGAKPERRVAAAAALASLSDPAVKARVRTAAEACVNEKLRTAILRAADGVIEGG
jgi:hypothetical protein